MKASLSNQIKIQMEYLMKNITPMENDFQNSEAATVARINRLRAAIASAPGDAVNLISAHIETENDSAVKSWLVQFRETFQTLKAEVNR